MASSLLATRKMNSQPAMMAGESSGATIRLYIEQYTDDAARLKDDAQVALGDIIAEALKLSKLPELTGRDKPTVIT